MLVRACTLLFLSTIVACTAAGPDDPQPEPKTTETNESVPEVKIDGTVHENYVSLRQSTCFANCLGGDISASGFCGCACGILKCPM